VDVNILEELSSSRRSELDDLWQDFTTGMQGYSSYRSLDRIGLGKERKRVSGLEVLAKNTNLMVVGKPGSGKTTYLQRVVTECNAGNLQAHRIPVLIKLREFMEDGRELAYSLERYLERCWRLSDAETQLVFDQGRALMLLDGLDEMTGEDGKNITKEIKRFARGYPQVQVIVTCRTQSQESRFERFDYVEVADFKEPQVRAFAQHWFKTVMGDESAGLAKAQEFLGQLFLEENKPIRELTITPILLSLTCAVFRQTGKFYSKRSKLYEEGLELLLEQWDKSRSIERDKIYRDLSVERKLELLSYLAVKKFEQQQYVLFEQAEVEGYIAEFLGIGQRDSRVVLRAIESQHGLLIERSQRIYSFSHLTLQEYFTAKWFVDHADWQGLVSHITKKHWREVFLLAVSIIQNVNDLLRLIQQQVDSIISLDEKAQKFLNWVNLKCKSTKLSYKSAAIRAFYFTCDQYGLGVNGDVYGLVSAIDNDLGYDISLSIALNKEDRDYPYYGTTSSEVEHAYERSFELVLHHDLMSALALHFPNRDFDPIKRLDNTLGRKLVKLKTQIPGEGQFDKIFQEWRSKKGRAWAEQFRVVMVKHHNSGHDWRFSKEQKKLLQEYYDVNKLLVDCLNSGCVVSDEAREEIEDILLLPIAEIEKRKREKLEEGIYTG
jgi:predicted NACHT family NTPase